MENDTQLFPYLHGFSSAEQARLRKQARFAEHSVFRHIDLSRTEHLLEVGCGVGAQTEILLRRFPDLKITGIDINENQLAVAHHHLEENPLAHGRANVQKMNAMAMDFSDHQFDGAFFAWILEHVPDPAKVLSETKRVLKPGAVVYLSEVLNSHFFLDPYSPNVWKYWMAFNDFQYDRAGDPFIGAKLGNLLVNAGFKSIQTRLRTWHFDKRHPSQRQEHLDYWLELMMSAEKQLIDANYVTQEIANEARKEMLQVKANPNGVFLACFMQAKAYT